MRINLGPDEDGRGLPRASLCDAVLVADLAHPRRDLFAKALAELVNYQHRQPFAAHWGDGTTHPPTGSASKPGVAARPAGSRQCPLRQRARRTFYTHVSDQYAPPYQGHQRHGARRHPCARRSAVSRVRLRIEEHYTDTAGFTDHVFALCHLLGFRFAPRIRDLADKRLYVLEKPSSMPTLEPLIGGTRQPEADRAAIGTKSCVWPRRSSRARSPPR